MGDCQTEPLRPHFDRRLRLRFLGAGATSDAGLLAYRELDDALDSTHSAASDLIWKIPVMTASDVAQKWDWQSN